MTDDSPESRPTADGELRKRIFHKIDHFGEDAYRTYQTEYYDDYREAVTDDLLHLIKQNTPSKESVVPKSSSPSEPDSSIPDDDSLESQPQPDKEWQHDWIDEAYDAYMQSLPDADKRAEYQAPLKLKAAIQSHIQQLQQQHEAEVLEARIDTAQFAQNGIRDALVPVSDVRKLVRVRVVDEMLDKFIEELESQLAHLKQQQQERLAPKREDSEGVL